MAHPTCKEASCQFLSSLEAKFYSTEHKVQGWGSIKFKISGKVYSMSFKEIGEALGFQDGRNYSLPVISDGEYLEENHLYKTWKLLSGSDKISHLAKSSSIRNPAVRYLHRLLVHTLFPRKEFGRMQEDDLKLLYQAIHIYASPSQLPTPKIDHYKSFGMVGFFVKKLEYFKGWAWTTTDASPQLGIGGMITALLDYMDIPLGNKITAPTFMDGLYLRTAQYFSGIFEGQLVYTYKNNGKATEVLLPRPAITSLSIPGNISFDIDESYFLGPHGPLDTFTAKKKTVKLPQVQEQEDSPSEKNEEHIYGPPRYHFKQHNMAPTNAPICQLHQYVNNLQRWNKAQDRTIWKLKEKCIELSNTVKKQAEASAQFMKKVAEVFSRGAGCSSNEFDFITPEPEPPHNPLALSFPLTTKQWLRQRRNPKAYPSESGNKSPSLASTERDSSDTDEEATASSKAT